MSNVTVYSTQDCQYCRMAKAFLDKHGVPYESIDVGSDSKAAEKMIELSGQRGVPVIVVDDEVIVGFDSQRLNELFGEAAPEDVNDVVIVGAGPAGLTAGVYCARKMLKTVIISENIGGQALESWAIENYMGYRMVTGEELMKKFEEQVRTLNIRLELDRVTGITKEGSLFMVKTVSGRRSPGKVPHPHAGQPAEKTRCCKRGAVPWPRALDLLDLRRAALPGKKVAVVGGGNSALQTAIEMSEHRRHPWT